VCERERKRKCVCEREREREREKERETSDRQREKEKETEPEEESERARPISSLFPEHTPIHNNHMPMRVTGRTNQTTSTVDMGLNVMTCTYKSTLVQWPYTGAAVMPQAGRRGVVRMTAAVQTEELAGL